MKLVTESSFKTLDNCTDPENLFWTSESEKEILKTCIFNVTEVHRKSTENVEGDFIQIHPHDWVNIIPYFIGSNGKARFVMERQYRHGSNSITVEFPAGIIEENEDPEVAAQRELLEETGIKAHSVKFLCQSIPNAAIMTNKSYFFLAETLEDTGKRKLDKTEQIEVITVPVADVISNVGKGEFNNGVVMMNLFLFLREKGFIQ